MKDYVVYAITDPRSDEIFYIGYSGDLGQRKETHLTRPHGACWRRLRAILHDGALPRFSILEHARSEGEALDAETFWISLFRSRGAQLLNMEARRSPAARRAECRGLDGGTACFKGKGYVPCDHEELVARAQEKGLPARTGRKWREEDEQLLIWWHGEGLPPAEMALRLQRTENAVLERLRRLGLGDDWR